MGTEDERRRPERVRRQPSSGDRFHGLDGQRDSRITSTASRTSGCGSSARPHGFFGFCASRPAGERGAAFGVLPPGLGLDPIIGRAAPEVG